MIVTPSRRTDDGRKLNVHSITSGCPQRRLPRRKARAFGFGDFAIPNTKKSDFADKILTAYRQRRLEAAVGTQNSDMRLALNARRELSAIAAKGLSADGKWFTADDVTAYYEVVPANHLQRIRQRLDASI